MRKATFFQWIRVVLCVKSGEPNSQKESDEHETFAALHSPAMELRHLRYFVVLAEELHFGNAAKRLHITQPPLSFNIRQLEESLGARLFVRDSRSVRLTPVGAAFLPEATRVLAQARAAEEAGRALAAGKAGKLYIAFTSSMLFRGVPDILRKFSAQHPHFELQLHDMTVLEQHQALSRRLIDASFCSGQFVPAGLEGIALAPDAFVCCVHDAHWAAREDTLALSALASEDFIVFVREITPAGYDHVLAMCMRAGFRPREVAHVRQWLTAAVLVSSGHGIAIVPASLRRAGLKNVRFIPLQDEDTRTSGFFVWNPGASSPGLEHLLEEVRRYVGSQQA
jgi:DNA-binding transcriptional LysR family regulator